MKPLEVGVVCEGMYLGTFVMRTEDLSNPGVGEGFYADSELLVELLLPYEKIIFGVV